MGESICCICCEINRVRTEKKNFIDIDSFTTMLPLRLRIYGGNRWKKPLRDGTLCYSALSTCPSLFSIVCTLWETRVVTLWEMIFFPDSERLIITYFIRAFARARSRRVVCPTRSKFSSPGESIIGCFWRWSGLPAGMYVNDPPRTVRFSRGDMGKKSMADIYTLPFARRVGVTFGIL